MKEKVLNFGNRCLEEITVKKILIIMLGAGICSFGIHNIHQRTNITEGGVIGLMLLIEHWLHISPAYITPILDLACYLTAFKYLGGSFIVISIISTFFVKSSKDKSSILFSSSILLPRQHMDYSIKYSSLSYSSPLDYVMPLLLLSHLLMVWERKRELKMVLNMV